MTFLGLFHLYGLLVGIAIVVALLVIQSMAKFYVQSKKDIEQALVWVGIGALIGARLYHLITDWSLYVGQSVFAFFAVWNGGLGILGGILGGVLGLTVFVFRSPQNKFSIFNFQFSKTKLTPFFMFLDLFSFGIPFGQAIGRLGNYANNELYGTQTSLPWGILIQGSRYHPLFLYELLADFGLGLFLLYLGRRKLLVLGKGQYVSLYITGYGMIRFWLEFLRLQTDHIDGVLGVLSIAQWVSLLFMVLGTSLFWLRRHSVGTKHIKQWDWSLE